jgi:hypothetical protein
MKEAAEIKSSKNGRCASLACGAGQVQDKMIGNETLRAQAKANTLENYRHGFDPAFLDALIELRHGNVKFFNRAIEDESFRRFIADNLRQEVYRRQRMPRPKALT